jgi:AcrR family transcriptional regulator
MLGRREQYAEETRQAIVCAARRIFAERGYAKTRVEDIAKEAGVAAITVYTTVGGKSGLARFLFDIWVGSPIRNAAAERIAVSEDPVAILEITADTMRRMREEYADIIYTMHDAAPHDPVVAEGLEKATTRYRASCLMVAERVKETGGLREDLTAQEAGEILWFYFGYWSWYTLHNENGWSYEASERWLLASAKRAILKPRLIPAGA